MTKKLWFSGLLIGILAGSMVGVFFTLYDWNLNPGNIFQNEQGIHWDVMWDTFISWCWPIALIATPFSWGLLFLAKKFKA